MAGTAIEAQPPSLQRRALSLTHAYPPRQRFPGLQVFGGIVLDGSVGGLNPRAVQRMHRMHGQYGKVVWLPTIDAYHHVKFFRDAPEGVKLVGGDRPGLAP